MKPSYGLQEEEIARMLRDSMQFAEQDIQARMLAEQQVEADRVLESVQQALRADGDVLLERADRAVIETALHRLQICREGSDAEAITAAIAEVDHATAEFAARRMDASIRQALQGHQIDEV